MKHLIIPAVLAMLLAAPAAAQNQRAVGPGAEVGKIASSASGRISAGDGRVVISVSGREGGDVAAFARWHFAQSDHGEGRSRFQMN